MNIEKHNERVEKHYEHKIEATEARAEKREEHIEGHLEKQEARAIGHLVCLLGLFSVVLAL